jgi:F-type H+-transporting ATPase subunit delta
MAEALTIARPYAEAALEFAVAAGSTVEWSNQLALLAAIAADEQTKHLLKDPRITQEQQVALFIDIAGAVLDDNGRNFVRLLAEYHRLIILPEIHKEYQHLLAKKEQRLTAEVRTAQPLSDEQLTQMTAALKKRFNSTVIIKQVNDESLLGGALIQVGDLVIDGSLRGRLANMAKSLRS